MMCFYYPDGWEAELVEQEVRVATRPISCGECDRIIAIGEPYLHVAMREHETCQECWYGWCDCPKDEDGVCDECRCDEPAHGESFCYDRCLDCGRVLDAIEAAEMEAGCARDEARPALERLREAMIDDEDGRYRAKALAMFPDLASHLDRLARRRGEP